MSLLHDMLKRCVFRDDLKVSIGWQVLPAGSSEFQSIGLAELKGDLWQWLFLKCAGGIALLVDDLTALECVFEGSRSARYSGDSHFDNCTLVGIVYTVFFPGSLASEGPSLMV